MIRHYADCKNADSDSDFGDRDDVNSDRQLPSQGSNRAQIVIVASADAVAGTPVRCPPRWSAPSRGC